MSFKLEEIEECSKSDEFNDFMKVTYPLMTVVDIKLFKNINDLPNKDIIQFASTKWGKGDLFIATLEQVLLTRKLIINFL